MQFISLVHFICHCVLQYPGGKHLHGPQERNHPMTKHSLLELIYSILFTFSLGEEEKSDLNFTFVHERSVVFCQLRVKNRAMKI